MLELKFLLSDNSITTITLQKPKLNLTEGQINNAMNAIISSNCINKKGFTIVGKKQARYVERIITDMTMQ